MILWFNRSYAAAYASTNTQNIPIINIAAIFDMYIAMGEKIKESEIPSLCIWKSIRPDSNFYFSLLPLKLEISTFITGNFDFYNSKFRVMKVEISRRNFKSIFRLY